MDHPATAPANKTDPGYRDHPRRLQPVSGIEGEVQRLLPEDAQPQNIGNSTAGIAFLP